ncbi:MAG: serpin family protein [Pirellulales bacterium]
MRTALLLLVSALLLGCSDGKAPPRASPKAAGAKVTPFVPKGPPAPEVIESTNRFALDLYAEMAKREQGNVFFSPLSISTGLAMAYAGAGGQTKSEIAQVLHVAGPEPELHRTFAALRRDVHSRNATGWRVLLANRIWAQHDYDFHPEFFDLLAGHYQAEPAQVDFAGDTAGARRQINAWVREQTRGKIKDLVPDDVLWPSTRMVLTMAIYFASDWDHPFETGLTEEAAFYIAPERQVQVPMMNQAGSFAYFRGDGFQVLALPYQRDRFSMVLLLPDEMDGIAELEAQLDADQLRQWLAAMRHEHVDLFMPRFRLEARIDLREVLQSMGMQAAFDPNTAQFPRITSSEHLFISAALHKAYVDVDEQGTEAAAADVWASDGAEADDDKPPVFRADHPFLFLIRHNRTGAILFLGRLAVPNQH